MTNKLTYEQVRDRYIYDPETGVLCSRINSHGRRAGQEFNRRDRNGYVVLRLAATQCFAHRIAWMYMTGEWPDKVDHINGIKDDNRWCNLRSVDAAENCQNRRRPKAGNSTGFLGVSAHRGRFMAQIHTRGERVVLGVFDDPEEAHRAYVEAKRRLHPTCSI